MFPGADAKVDFCPKDMTKAAAAADLINSLRCILILPNQYRMVIALRPNPSGILSGGGSKSIWRGPADADAGDFHGAGAPGGRVYTIWCLDDPVPHENHRFNFPGVNPEFFSASRSR